MTALYFAQQFRKKREGGITEELKDLNEEMRRIFRRGKYIVAVQKEGQQIPILKEKDGQMYQPLFTDVQEFNKFNKEKNLKAAIIEFANLTKFLAPEAKGVIINPNAVNISWIWHVRSSSQESRCRSRRKYNGLSGSAREAQF